MQVSSVSLQKERVVVRSLNGRKSPVFVVNLVDVERIKGEAEDSVTCRDLAKELGTDCETIRNIAQKGSIKPCVRRSTDAFNTLRFRSSTVEKFRRSSLAAPSALQSRLIDRF